MHPYRGGIAHFTEMTVDVLRARGIDVHPINFSRQYPEFLFPGETQYERTADAPAAIRTAPRSLDSINPLSWGRTAHRLGTLQPDAVVFQYWMPFFAPAYGVIARWLRAREIPSLSIVHNALPHTRHLGDTWLSRFFLRACAGHIVMSDAVAADTRRLAGSEDRIEQIAHPVYERFGDPVPPSEARASLDLPGDGPVLLFFGFVREYKGLHVLLEAMPTILDRLPEARLVVAGEPYGDLSRYRELIDRHDLQDRVRWHDEYIPSAEVPRYFSAADLVVQPYVSATQSGVTRIATHFEVPMVVTDVGGLAEDVPHETCGFVVPPQSPAALADAVVRFFQNGWAAQLTEGMREQKHRQQPERLAEAIETLWGTIRDSS